MGQKDSLADDGMALIAGQRIGTYEIAALIGAGGMGEVYRARDMRLKRDVAIKILPDAFAQDSERLARFHREAELLATLNHPNIAQIYGLEDRALVLELVEGPTLADRIAQGPIPIDEALPIAKQIAEALEAAHERGIIHRDLKPGNIKLTPDGQVKVLDFGLAKSLEESAVVPHDLSHSPTITSPAMTMQGIILGTAAYMSPEQAKGRTADKRSDVWGFGCVLYEMLTGKRAFDGEDLTETIAAVVKSEPDWTALPHSVKQPIRTMLQRCLEKDRRRRISDLSAVLFVLAEHSSLTGPIAESVSAVAIDARASWNPRRDAALAAIVALLIGSAVGAMVMWRTRTPALEAPSSRFIVKPTGEAAITAIMLDREIAITPNGTHVIYVGNNGTQLFVRPLDQLEPSPLGPTGSPRGPFVSPDGRWVGFFDGDKLTKIAVTGGPAVTLSTNLAQRGGATWGRNDTIVFGTTDTATGLWRVSATGGEPVVLTKPNRDQGEADHLWPEFLPGGEAVLFTITSVKGGIGAAQIAVLDLKSGTQKIVLRGGSHAHYVSTGHLMYGFEGTLRAVPFDVATLEVKGGPSPVIDDVKTTEAGAANFHVSGNGTLVYVPVSTNSGARAERTLAWVDRQGREEPIKAPSHPYGTVRLSPDGTRIALDIREGSGDIWVWNLKGETLTRLTANSWFETNPVWMPDSRRIVFGGNRGVHWQAADGSGTAEFLGGRSSGQFPTSISPDGSRILFHANPTGDIMVLSMDEGHEVRPLFETQFGELLAEISPNGKWVAYEATDSGQPEIYVRPFPDAKTARWQVSTGGGSQPAWSRDGRELFYVTGTGAMTVVPVAAGDKWNAGPSQKLFEGPYFFGPGSRLAGLTRTYDVSPDGRRFLMIRASQLDSTNPKIVLMRQPEEGLVVIQNWYQELSSLVPVN